jgi:4-cresol dehydrogenase (hydroxylating)
MPSAFLQRCRDVIGLNHVIDDAATVRLRLKNTMGIERRVVGVLRPGSTEEVQRVVLLANEHRQPLHPISTGMNWGFGSSAPVTDGAVIVDLGRMNRIREFNDTFGYAVVEPGVTQQQLYRRIVQNGASFVLNVTGSAAESSLLGNLLDRGIGNLGPRALEASAFEVVLGNGEILRTGFGHYPSSRTTSLFPFGIGPGLDGLFIQSNYGIVTSATFALRRKPEEFVVLNVKIRDPRQLGPATDALAALCREHLFFGAARLGSAGRTDVVLSPVIFDTCLRNGMTAQEARAMTRDIFTKEVGNGWSVFGGIGGMHSFVREAGLRARRTMQRFGDVTLVRLDTLTTIRRLASALRFIPTVRRKCIFLEAMEPLLRSFFGIPTNLVIKSIYWPLGPVPKRGWENPDRHDDVGYLSVTPIIPMEGASVLQLLEATDRAFLSFGRAPQITLNEIAGRALECVITATFNRADSAQRTAAHECVAELQKNCIDLGFIPYRTTVASMSQLVEPGDQFWEVASLLKRVLDPNDVIAPRRYSLI